MPGTSEFSEKFCNAVRPPNNGDNGLIVYSRANRFTNGRPRRRGTHRLPRACDSGIMSVMAQQRFGPHILAFFLVQFLGDCL